MLLTKRCQRYTIIGHVTVFMLARGGTPGNVAPRRTCLYGQLSANCKELIQMVMVRSTNHRKVPSSMLLTMDPRCMKRCLWVIWACDVVFSDQWLWLCEAVEECVKL